jgi:hypothetical protein
MKTVTPTNRLTFNDWARYIKAEADRAKYGRRSLTLKRKAQHDEPCRRFSL